MTTNTNTAPDNCTILPDGSAFALASYPLPKDHWLYAPREYEPGAEEPKELPHPILTHAHRAEVVAAVRYAIRSATMCGKEKDFDPDALVQNAVYALCGPYGKAALSTAAQPQEELREDTSYESVNLAVMVLSDCGHSSNYEPLLERVAGRIDRHVERLLTAQRADLARRAQAEPVQPQASLPTVEQVEASMGMGHGAWDMVDPNELIKAIVTLAAAPKAEPLYDGDERRHVICLCPECARAEPAPASQDAEDALMKALERAYFWMDSQADAQSKGGHATFDLMMLREERDAAKAAIDAARARQEGK